MQRLLALDLSSKTGWALWKSTSLSEDKPLQPYTLAEYGLLKLGLGILEHPGAYPQNVKRAAWAMSDKVIELIHRVQPTHVVIEDTVPGRQALSQRFLEWLHYVVLAEIESDIPLSRAPAVVYLRTGEWRHTVGLASTKKDRDNNRMAKKLKELAKTSPELAKQKKKELGIRGKRTKKHYAVDMVNALWKLDFKVKDNDIADAILLGWALIQGAKPNDGT